MRQYLLLFLFLFTFTVSAQDMENPFAKEEIEAAQATSEVTTDVPLDAGPGNDQGGDDLPIDDYIPYLIAVGGLLIILSDKSKKRSIL